MVGLRWYKNKINSELLKLTSLELLTNKTLKLFNSINYASYVSANFIS